MVQVAGEDARCHDETKGSLGWCAVIFRGREVNGGFETELPSPWVHVGEASEEGILGSRVRERLLRGLKEVDELGFGGRGGKTNR